MRSTFRVLFYTKNQAIKNGRVPVMGRITVNGTTASFSCKRDVPGAGEHQGTDRQALSISLGPRFVPDSQECL